MTKITFVLSFFLLILITLVRCDSDVVSLTESNFNEKTTSGVWLVEFFAPWCGHCKSLAPVWEKLASEVKGDIHVGNVDCTVQKALCPKFGVKGYPTIKLLRDGKYFDYASARNIEAFTAFAREGYKSAEGKELPFEAATKSTEEVTKTEPQVVHLGESDFYKTVAEGTWIVKYYAPWCGHCKTLAPVLDDLSAKTDGKFKVAKVDCTVHRSVCSDFGVRGYPTIKLIKDGKSYDYAGARTIEAFTTFAHGGYSSATSAPLPGVAKAADTEDKEEKNSGKEVVVLTQGNFDEKIASGEWLVEFYAPWCGHCKHLAPIWDELATKTEVNVAKVDCTVEKDLMPRFGVRGFPTIKFIKDGQVYDYKGARTVDAFLSFSKTGYKEASSAPLKEATKDEL